jgi:hypothetical protein
MKPSCHFFRFLNWTLLAFLGAASPVLAHPVAQGSVEISIEEKAVVALFRVSNEQVFVASSGKNAPPSASLDALWQDHADYLLAHVTALADGTALTGTLAKVEPPADLTTRGFTLYQLRYPWPNGTLPARLEIHQNLLSEIEFAPGNPWEATFVARIWHGERSLSEGALWSAKQPLVVSIEPQTDGQKMPSPQNSLPSLASGFFRHGMHHIASAWDHALFVSALVLAVARLWPVLALVTAFTLAHTVTLTLGVLKLAQFPGNLVEPVIAGSITVAALLNLWKPSAPRLLPRLGLAFGFGLVHGMGFANDLVEAMEGFSRPALAAAIGGFSIGVEVGHQLIVLPLILIMVLVRRFAPGGLPRVLQAGSVVVAIAGGWLLVQTLR